MKKSYVLLLSVILITLFSYLSIKIATTKALKNENEINHYLYIQAKNHKEFLKEYIYSLKDLEEIEHLNIQNDSFEIEAFIKKEESKNFFIQIYVKSKYYDISVYEKFLITN